MQSILEQKKRRFYRLKSYFAPYQDFKLRIRHDIETPFEFEVQEASEVLSTSSFIFHVASVLLSDNAPDWMEAYLLLLALEKRNAVFFVDSPSELSDAYFKQVVSTFEQLKKAEKQKLEEEAKCRRDYQAATASNTENDISKLWHSLRVEYFPDRDDLDSYEVLWSNRKQTSSLASCSLEHRRVVIARAMQEGAALSYLEPLLYHEMCHAALGEPKIVKGRRIMHGSDFKALEKKHPRIKELNTWIKGGGWQHVVEKVEF